MDSMSISAFRRMEQDAVRLTRTATKAVNVQPKTSPQNNDDTVKPEIIEEPKQNAENKRGLDYYA